MNAGHDETHRRSRRVPVGLVRAGLARGVLIGIAVGVLGACSTAATTKEQTATSEDAAGETVAVPAETTGPPNTAPVETTTSTLRPPVTVPSIDPVTGPGTATAFLELRADEDGALVRWYESRLSVAIAGTPTPTDLHILGRYVESVSQVEGVPRLEIVDRVDDADIVVHFLPKNRWREAIGEASVGAEVDGQARYRQIDGEITGVTVVVNSLSSQLQRNRTIVHEMLHAYGLGHHSCPGGLLYRGSEYEPEWRLAEYDRVLLEAWYAEHADEPQVALDIPCPRLVWDTVTFEGVVLWCRVGDGACYEVDERDGVDTTQGPFGWYVDGSISLHDPERYVAFTSDDGRVLCTLGNDAYQACETGALREVTRPNRWYDGASLYDYNPETHLVRIYEGRRLLCLKPSGKRAPCQFTTGHELTGTDLYTDGEYVYTAP